MINTKVAVIDDGVNKSILSNICKNNLYLYKVDNNKVEIAKSIYNINHGTICCAIIAEYSPYVDIISISIKNECSKIFEKHLLIALDWCLKNNINFINLSMSTNNYFSARILRPYLLKLKKKDIFLISSNSNNNKLSYPACLPEVIGVKQNFNNTNNDIFFISNNSYDGINIMTSMPNSKNFNLLVNKYGVYNECTNSWLSAYITALFSNHTIKKNLIKYNNSYFNIDIAEQINTEFDIIPSILIVFQERKEETINLSKKLTCTFQKNGYLATLISPYIKTDFYNNFFNIDIYSNNNLTLLIQNIIRLFMSIDIIFVCVSQNEINDLFLETFNFDLLFSYGKPTINISKNVDIRYLNSKMNFEDTCDVIIDNFK